jgi:DNA gyrase subunit A
VIALQLSERNGRMVAALQLLQTDDVMLISQGGTLVRTAVDQVSVLGRNTQGVRLMRVEEGDRLVGLARVEHIDGEQGDDEPPDADLDAGGPVPGAPTDGPASPPPAAGAP